MEGGREGERGQVEGCLKHTKKSPRERVWQIARFLAYQIHLSAAPPHSAPPHSPHFHILHSTSHIPHPTLDQESIPNPSISRWFRPLFHVRFSTLSASDFQGLLLIVIIHPCNHSSISRQFNQLNRPQSSQRLGQGG